MRIRTRQPVTTIGHQRTDLEAIRAKTASSTACVPAMPISSSPICQWTMNISIIAPVSKTATPNRSG